MNKINDNIYLYIYIIYIHIYIYNGILSSIIVYYPRLSYSITYYPMESYGGLQNSYMVPRLACGKPIFGRSAFVPGTRYHVPGLG